MNEPPTEKIVIEPERYEFSAPPAYHFEFDRRDFMKIFGAGVAVFLVCRDSLAAQESGRRRANFDEHLPQNIGVWLHVGGNGEVSIFTGKVEIGQNIRTSLSQAVAEELRVPISSLRLVMGDTQLTPFDMGTFGSRTTPTMNLQLRRVASVARDTLVQLAAKQWNADAAKLVAQNGRVSDPGSGRS
ncbi:MAG TPA: molybdopterin cofactor-binding domain-containing protein, partial [Terriglobia bacterium]|nr:molybdopterin cofactor-binding domain-containing protein [Terriglobia bacterium]